MNGEGFFVVATAEKRSPQNTQSQEVQYTP